MSENWSLPPFEIWAWPEVPKELREKFQPAGFPDWVLVTYAGCSIPLRVELERALCRRDGNVEVCEWNLRSAEVRFITTASSGPTQGVMPSDIRATLDGKWLSPEKADAQHGQVWTVKTRGGAVIPLAQLDGYDTERGRRYWRAINIETHRRVQVRHVLEGSCPRVGGRRERAKSAQKNVSRSAATSGDHRRFA